MTPIERVRARAASLQALGLGQYASESEIRDAWKRIAMETHPDQTNGSQAKFAKAKAAYDMLRGDEGDITYSSQHKRTPYGKQPHSSSGGVKPGKRPVVQTRTMALSPEAVDDCTALLDAEVADPQAVVDLSPVANADGSAPTSKRDHIPEHVHRRGRRLTYVVRGPLAKGCNRVALPTSVLDGHRDLRPMVISFRSTTSGSGEFSVPVDVIAAVFPGARIVSIRFVAD